MPIDQSIESFENWRDRQHDRPETDNDAPDEQITRSFSHDHPEDTTLTYTRTETHAELKLTFASEDPDTGVEELLYMGNHGESMTELAADLRAELTAWLDARDTSSFAEQQGIPVAPDMSVVYGDYTRTALYAFEDALTEVERNLNQQAVWKPIETEKQDWLYSGQHEADAERGCIGHLRGDFGRGGNEFWTSWFDHSPGLKSAAFREELQSVVNHLREEGGLLSGFSAMRSQCRSGLACDDSYGFYAETARYEYCLRCIPRRDDYHFYLYCYDKDAQREHAREKAVPVRDRKPKPEKIHEMERLAHGSE